jgi:hypothetical protein
MVSWIPQRGQNREFREESVQLASANTNGFGSCFPESPWLKKPPRVS